MRDEPVAPETKGVATKLLAAVDLGPRDRGHGTAPTSNADGDHRAWRRLRTDPRPHRQAGHRVRPAGHDHRPSRRRRDGLRTGGGLARGSEHVPLAREPGRDPCGRDLGRHRQPGVIRGAVRRAARTGQVSGRRLPLGHHRPSTTEETHLPATRLGALCWNQYTTWPDLLEAGQRADRLGYDTLWTWDPHNGDVPSLKPLVGIMLLILAGCAPSGPSRSDLAGTRPSRPRCRARRRSRRARPRSGIEGATNAFAYRMLVSDGDEAGVSLVQAELIRRLDADRRWLHRDGGFSTDPGRHGDLVLGLGFPDRDRCTRAIPLVPVRSPLTGRWMSDRSACFSPIRPSGAAVGDVSRALCWNQYTNWQPCSRPASAQIGSGTTRSGPGTTSTRSSGATRVRSTRAG